MKINIREYPNIWFCSDLHYGHKQSFLYEPRGCVSREDHMRLLTENINSVVGKDDLLIHLGDFCLTTEYDEFREWMMMGINCNNIMSITGNHDNRWIKLVTEFHSDNPSSICRVAIDYGKSIIQLGKFKEITIQEPSDNFMEKDCRYHITLCHFPLICWNHSHHGSYHLSGHSHGSLHSSSLDSTVGKLLDVGVENALKYTGNVVFNWDDIKCIMNGKSIGLVDHHNENTN